MKKGEKVLLTVKPQCKFVSNRYLYAESTIRKKFVLICTMYLSSIHSCVADAFGEKGRPATSNECAVPPNTNIQIALELVSWTTVSEVTDDKMVMKKILKEGEGYERPNDGAVVTGKFYHSRLVVKLPDLMCYIKFISLCLQ